MIKNFTCRHTYGDGEKASWTGTVLLIEQAGPQAVAHVRGRGSCFTIVIGKNGYGNYLCVPEADVGCRLSDWDDIFWNRERLSRLMNAVDAVTVVTGIKALMEGQPRKKAHSRGQERGCMTRAKYSVS